MTAKDFIFARLDLSGKYIFETARKVPADKLEWKPLDNGRSTLALAQECAQCPLWTVDVLKNQAYDSSNSEEEGKAYEEACKALTSLEACETAFAANLAKLKEAITAFPEADMTKSITIPWGTFTFADLMFVAAWNCDYHAGQINYIQTLYGDMSM